MGPKISLPMGVKDMERLRHELRKDIEMYGKPETEIGNISGDKRIDSLNTKLDFRFEKDKMATGTGQIASPV